MLILISSIYALSSEDIKGGLSEKNEQQKVGLTGTK